MGSQMMALFLGVASLFFADGRPGSGNFQLPGRAGVKFREVTANMASPPPSSESMLFRRQSFTVSWLPFGLGIAAVAIVAAATQRQRTRTREQIAVERKRKFARTSKEIDALYKKYLGALGRRRKGHGTAYARYSTRFQDSIADQLKVILKYAAKKGIYIKREHIFFDLAVRGYKRSRSGLDQVQQLLKDKQVDTLLLFKTSRLFRKTYLTLQFVDQAFRGWGIRCIFVKSGVDTNDKQKWEQMLHMQSQHDQFVVTVYVDNIHAAHVSMLEKRLVFGTLSYGYAGQPIEGRRTKRAKPRCEIVIDDETARIVKQVFCWYVDDRLAIIEIVRRLNSLDIPLSPRCLSGEWTRTAVRNILQNTRYRGLWRYGVTEAVYLPAEDYTKQRVRAKPLAQVLFEELRLVSDEQWYAAEQRLNEDIAACAGRKARDGRRRLDLNRYVWCGEHERQMIVGGSRGQYMFCPACLAGPCVRRSLFSQLNRRWAFRALCTTVASLLDKEASLHAAIVSACQTWLLAAQSPDEQVVKSKKNRIDQLTRSIEITRRTVGDSKADQAEANEDASPRCG